MLIYILHQVLTTQNEDISISFRDDKLPHYFSRSQLIYFEYFDSLCNDSMPSIRKLFIGFLTYEELLNCIKLCESKIRNREIFGDPPTLLRYLALIFDLKTKCMETVLAYIINNMVELKCNIDFYNYILNFYNPFQTDIEDILKIYTCMCISRSYNNGLNTIICLDKSIFIGKNTQCHLEIENSVTNFSVKIYLRSDETINQTKSSRSKYLEYLKSVENLLAELLLYSYIIVPSSEKVFTLKFKNSATENPMGSQLLDYFLNCKLLANISKKVSTLIIKGFIVESDTIQAFKNYIYLLTVEFSNCILSEAAIFRYFNTKGICDKLTFIKLISTISTDKANKNLILPNSIILFELKGFFHNTSLHTMKISYTLSNIKCFSIYISENFEIKKLNAVLYLSKVVRLNITIASGNIYENMHIVDALIKILSKKEIRILIIDVKYGIFRTSWLESIPFKMLFSTFLSGCILDSPIIQPQKNYKIRLFSPYIFDSFLKKQTDLFEIEKIGFEFLGFQNIIEAFLSKISIIETAILDFMYFKPLLNTIKYDFKRCRELKIKNILPNNKEAVIEFLNNCVFFEVKKFTAEKCVGLESILSILSNCKLEKIKVVGLVQSESSFWAKLARNLNFKSIMSIKVRKPECIRLIDLEFIFGFPNLTNFSLYDYVIEAEIFETILKGGLDVSKFENLEVQTTPHLIVFKRLHMNYFNSNFGQV